MAYPQNPIDAATLALLRVRIGLAGDDTSRDTELTSVWYAARLTLEAYLNRSLYVGTHTDTFLGPVSRIISLAAYPVDSVSAVTVSNVGEVTDYTLQAINGLLLVPCGAYAPQITVTYDATPPGDDVFMSALLWAFSSVWYQRYGEVTIGAPDTVKATAIDGMRTDYFDPASSGGLDISINGGGFPAGIAAMLAPYRRESA